MQALAAAQNITLLSGYALQRIQQRARWCHILVESLHAIITLDNEQVHMIMHACDKLSI